MTLEITFQIVSQFPFFTFSAWMQIFVEIKLKASSYSKKYILWRFEFGLFLDS